MIPIGYLLPRVLIMFAALFLTTLLRAAIPADAMPVTGVNLTKNIRSSTAVYWNDAMLMASDWNENGSKVTQIGVPTDADGWPTDLQGNSIYIPIFFGNGFHYPTGDYVLAWTGTGDLSLQALGGGTSPSLVSSTAGRKVYHVADTTADGFKVVWNTTSLAPNNVRNVHLWLPGQENTPNFITATVATEHTPAEVLRMMDWGETNGNWFIDWTDRPKANGPMKHPVPYETMIAVCNELGKDLWICVPHKATDDFVTQLATLIRDNLDAGLFCWVEYSNEVWNNGFSQTNWVKNSTVFPGANLDEKYAYRAGQVFNLFYGVFGASAPNRLIRVCGSQATDPLRTKRRLDALGSNVDTAAIAPYFGRGTGGSKTTHNSVNQWLVDNWNNGALTFAQFRDYLITTEIDIRLQPLWVDNQNRANAAGVPLTAYEGGQHILDAQNLLTASQQTFVVNFEDSPEMGEALRHALDVWRTLGGKTYLIYKNYGPGNITTGFWGHRAYSGEPLASAPKWQAWLDWVVAAGVQPPTITTQPASQTASVGSTATFSVVATSPDGGILSYQWKKGTTNVGTNSANYTTPTLTAADNGSTYSVVVTNTLNGSSATTTSASATLTVTSSITETMESSTFPTAFGNGSYVGDGGLTWIYNQTKATTINSTKAAWLRNGGFGTMATTPSSAVKSVSLQFKARTTSANTQLQLLVAGVVVATSPLQGTTLAPWTVTGLTGAPSSEIKIKCISSGQAEMDNIAIGF